MAVSSVNVSVKRVDLPDSWSMCPSFIATVTEERKTLSESYITLSHPWISGVKSHFPSRWWFRTDFLGHCLQHRLMVWKELIGKSQMKLLPVRFNFTTCSSKTSIQYDNEVCCQLTSVAKLHVCLATCQSVHWVVYTPAWQSLNSALSLPVCLSTCVSVV